MKKRALIRQRIREAQAKIEDLEAQLREIDDKMDTRLREAQ
jgi:hypothetical protein